MKRHYLLILTASAVLALPSLVQGQASTPAAGDVENGKRLFTKQNCYYCHGTEGQGGRDGARIAQIGLNAQGLIRYVRRPAGAMPAFSEKMISDQELTDIYAYLKSLPKAKVPKDIPLLDQLK
jgi:mono/diheme cytochrome c family protein